MGWGRILPGVGIAILLGGSVFGQTRDVDGRPFAPFAPTGKASLIFFVQTDCPVSNSYAPEIQRICKVYASKGVSCALAYEDVSVTAGAVRKHMSEYAYRGIPATIDASRAMADRARATITPEAVVVDARGSIRYRGRIDNFYAALGKPRQVVTEHDLTDALDAILAGTPVPRPETEALGCYITRPLDKPRGKQQSRRQ
jgi:thiol-disulfide isomerase/thioredoxin